MNYSILAIILVCWRINMLRSMQAQGTWLQVKSLPNSTASIPKNLSVISVASRDRNKPARSSECWFGPPAAPRKRLYSPSFEIALIEDIIVNVGAFHGQEHETLSEMDGEMRCKEGRKDCKLGVSVLRARTGRWETLAETDACRHTGRHTNRGTRIHIFNEQCCRAQRNALWRRKKKKDWLHV